MEGSRYVEIPSEQLLGLLRDIGSKVSARGGVLTEGVQGREVVVDLQPAEVKTVVRVYTSLSRGADAVRGCGEDAVRLVVGYMGNRNGKPEFRPLTQGRRIYRTAPTQLSHEKRVEAFLERFQDALREVYAEALNWTACPSANCKAPMHQRTNRNHGTKFWGCTRYPACNATRRID